MDKVSIIIPCKNINKYAKDCIRKCKELNYPDFEIIVLPDYINNEDIVDDKDVKIIPTGKASPGKKRNIGVENSSGNIVAFIDDDAYPIKDWLKNAVKYLKDPKVAAVGGPGITPPEDSDMQKVSGYIYSSFLMGGLKNRYKMGKPYESDDIHSCNFIVKKEIFEKVRWNEEYWPGEDTLICLEIKKLGFKMIEAPDVIVYHHRRPLFIPHLRQVYRFGLHRGHFFKKFPENSRKLIYIVPSLLVGMFVFWIVSLILALYLPIVKYIALFMSLIMLVYVILAFVAALDQTKSPKLLILTWIGIILTHLVYGIGFIIGLLKKDLRKRW
ncbi:glycosyltransferase [Methanocaldococcus indicus]|uniref:glycosyltransferase n=1 Tax=Methanocaldococcus indicus TaxID=213231 RepID=UPI003C6D17F5